MGAEAAISSFQPRRRTRAPSGAYNGLGRDSHSVVMSSCRFRGLFALSGEIEVDTSASGETHYVHAFITSGDLYDGHLHEFELDLDDLTRRIAARATLQMTWSWRLP